MTTIAWVKEEPFGMEFVDAARRDGALSAVGVAIGTDPVPYRLDYVLETDTDLVTTRCVVASRSEGWHQTLELRRSKDAEWSARTRHEGRTITSDEISELAGALDVDLGLSPFTNTMPVIRHQLLDGHGTADFVMAWVSVPDLTVTPDPQRYTAMEPGPDGVRRVRFDSLDSDFTADLTYDDQGFVVDYPGLAGRITPA